MHPLTPQQEAVLGGNGYMRSEKRSCGCCSLGSASLLHARVYTHVQAWGGAWPSGGGSSPHGLVLWRRAGEMTLDK